MINVNEYLTHHTTMDKVPQDVRTNAALLVSSVNVLLNAAPEECKSYGLRSGYRPPAYNATVPNAAVNSTHMTGNGVDISDNDGILDNWLTDAILQTFGLYREHPSQTKGWCHLQRVPPRSGNRTYYA